MDGVIFDLFGTIIPRPDRKVHSQMMENMGRLLGLEMDEFRRIWLSLTPEKTTWKKGDTVDLMEFIIKRTGAQADRNIAQRMADIWYEMTLSHFNYFPDVVPVFEMLRKEGCKVGLLTNCGPNVPEIVEGSVIGPLLDGAAYSCRMGIMKPHPGSYHIACELIGTKPERTLFVGDGDSNELPGAVKAGLHALKLERGDIAGDYRLSEEPDWENTITDLSNILQFVRSI
jgi:putative hydrolase of the HAD superfamily